MTITYVDAVSEQLPATDTTIYSCPATASSAHIQFANATNEDASTTIVVNIVQSGGSVAVTNQYIPSTTITGTSSSGLTGIVNAVLKPGDFISAIAGAADSINLKLGIKEIS